MLFIGRICDGLNKANIRENVCLIYLLTDVIRPPKDSRRT